MRIVTFILIRKAHTLGGPIVWEQERKNIGWRLDYFVVSERIKGQITDAKINSEIMGSDHCPVELHINF